MGEITNDHRVAEVAMGHFVQIDLVDQPKYEEQLSQLREIVGKEQFSKEWENGRSLAIDQLVSEPVDEDQSV